MYTYILRGVMLREERSLVMNVYQPDVVVGDSVQPRAWLEYFGEALRSLAEGRMLVIYVCRPNWVVAAAVQTRACLDYFGAGDRSRGEGRA
jgi:hypothetical protein